MRPQVNLPNDKVALVRLKVAKVGRFSDTNLIRNRCGCSITLFRPQ
jgi:hypothetical protein